MATDPLGTAKAASAAISAVNSVIDSATKPGGVGSRLIGLDLIRADLRYLGQELEKFSRLVEKHHDQHFKAEQSIGMLLQEFKHLETRINDRFDAAAKLADARAAAQEQALRDFEARLKLLGEVVRTSIGKGV
jgi:hypothetical protein